MHMLSKVRALAPLTLPRGYEKDPVVAAAKEDALRQMIAWFNAHLLSKS